MLHYGDRPFHMPDSYYDPPDYKDEAPRTTFSRHKTIKFTRKPHVCTNCGQVIPFGSSAQYTVSLDEYNKFEHGWSHFQYAGECIK